MVVGNKPVRYAITNLFAHHTTCPLDAAESARMRLHGDLRRWIVEGINFVQLREKAAEAGALASLAKGAMDLLRAESGPTGRPKLLVNGRADIAAAARADGVHLTARRGELTPGQVRAVFHRGGLSGCVVSVSCHSLDEVAAARDGGADLILFGPVFEKAVAGRQVATGRGLAELHRASVLAGAVPVLALGGITEATVAMCIGAGAAGVAAIRLFGEPAPGAFPLPNNQAQGGA